MNSSRRILLRSLKAKGMPGLTTSPEMGYAFSHCTTQEEDLFHRTYSTLQRFVSDAVQASTAYRTSTRKMTNAVRQAAYLLGKHSIPFW